MSDTSPTMTTSEFIQTIGVNAHLNDADSSYGSSDVLAQMEYLGIDQIRASDYEGSELSMYSALGQAGIKFDLITVIAPQNPINLSSEIDLIDNVAPYVVSVEGPNEVNTDPVTYDGVTGAAAAVDFQEDLYAAVHADSKLQGVDVLPYSLSVGGSFSGYGDVSAYADEGNVHGYASDGVPPDYMLAYAVSSVPSTMGLPVVMTETGNYTLDDDGSGVNQYVQSVWMMDTLLENAQSGVAKTFIYQLEDGSNSPDDDSENNYGLYQGDGTPKQAATDIHNLTSILADQGKNAGTFVPAPLDYTVSGLNSNYGFQEMFSKSDGDSDIALWSEPRFFEASTYTQSPVMPSAVTVSLGAGSYDISVFDPVTGTAAIQTQSDVASVSVSLATDPLIVQVTPVGNVTPPKLDLQTNDGRFMPGEAFSLALPEGTFDDGNGGALTYAAQQEDGSALPSWLMFNASTLTLSGTAPSGADVQPVVITATTPDGAGAAEEFHLYTAATRPVLNEQAPDQRLGAGHSFSFSLPEGSYSDPSGGSVSYSAEQANGASLPSWVSFAAGTDTFSGTTPITASDIDLKVIATTSSGGVSAEAFHIYSSAPAPNLQHQAPDQFLAAGSNFAFSLPAQSYVSPDGSPVSLTSEQASMAALPSWVSFNAQTGVFSGTAPTTPSGSSTAALGIRIDAMTANGGTAAEAFHIYTH